VAARSESYACGRSLVGIAGCSNPDVGMDVCVVCSKQRQKDKVQDIQHEEQLMDIVHRKNKRIQKHPAGSEIICTRPVRPWGPHSLLSNGYGFSLRGVKAAGAWM
jgi:hypothetical protein